MIGISSQSITSLREEETHMGWFVFVVLLIDCFLVGWSRGRAAR